MTSRLNRNRLLSHANWVFIYTAIVSFFQVVIGGDFYVLIIFIILSVIVALALVRFGAFSHVGLMLLLVYWMTVGIGVGVKTIMLEPLDSRLQAPITSFLVVLIFVVGFLISSIAVFGINKKTSARAGVLLNIRELWRLSLYCGVLGFGFWVANRLLAIDVRSTDADAIVGTRAFGALLPMYYVAVLASTLVVLEKTKGAISLGRENAGFLVVGIAMALVDGQKMGIGMTVLSYMLCSICYRKYITKTQVSSLVALLLFGFFVVFPLIHIVRDDLWQLGFGDRIQYIVHNYISIITTASINELQVSLGDVVQSNFFAYFGTNNLILDRFALIQHVDAIVGAVEHRGSLEAEIIIDSFFQFLPSLIFPNKELFYAGDIITWKLGLRSYGVVGFPTVPASAQLFSVGGLGLVFVGAIFLGGLFCSMAKVLGECFDKSLLGMYFVLIYVVSCAGWGVSHFSQKILLAFPLQIVVFIIVLWVASLNRKKLNVRAIFGRGLWVNS